MEEGVLIHGSNILEQARKERKQKAIEIRNWQIFPLVLMVMKVFKSLQNLRENAFLEAEYSWS